MRPRAHRPAFRRPSAARFGLVTLICVMVFGALPLSAATLQAWRKRVAGAGLTVGINPLNPNTVVVEGASGVLSISYDRGVHWQVWSTPPTTFIRQIIIHPNDTMTVFCASSGPDLLRSTDYGVTWQGVLPNFGIDGESVTYDPVHPDTMYAGNFGDGKVFRSTNRGTTWALRGDVGGLGSANLCTIAVRPDSANILYAGSGGGRISKSTDAGATWTVVKNGTAPPGTFQETPRIVVHPLAPSIAYATTYGEIDSTLDVWKSVDGGEHWSRTALHGLATWSLECDPTDTNTVYAGSFTGTVTTVFKSVDGGASWTSEDVGLPAGGFMWNMKIHPLDPSIIWMSVTSGSFGPNGLYRLLSTSTILEGDLLDADSLGVIANGSVEILSTGDVASISPSQLAFRFGYFEGDPSPTSTLHIASYPYVLTDVPVAFVADTVVHLDIALQRLARHSIGGHLLDSVTLEPIRAVVHLTVHRSIGDTLLSDSTDINGIFQFPQQYVSAPPVNWYGLITIDAPPPYPNISLGPVSLPDADIMFEVPMNQADVFLIAAADSSKYLSYYQNALAALGVSSNAWDLSRRGPAPLSAVPKFRFKTVIYYTGDLAAPLPVDALDSLTSCLDAGGHLLLTGQNVAEYNAASPLFASYLGVGFAGNTTIAFNQGVDGDFLQGFNFFTTGVGANNQTSRDSLLALRPDVHPLLDYGINTGRTAGVRVDSAGAGNAIVLGFGFEAIHTDAKRQALLEKLLNWFRGINAVDPHDPPAIPASFALDQNYPNPFNPSTTIRFRLPASSQVSLRIYDVTGALVTSLLDRTMQPGAYSVPWSAQGVSSGVYFYRLVVSDDASGAPRFSETRKLLLLR